INDISTITPEDDVISSTTVDDIHPIITRQDVVERRPDDILHRHHRIRSFTGGGACLQIHGDARRRRGTADGVVAVAAVEVVVAQPALQLVIPGGAGDVVGAVGADPKVVAGSADDRVVAAADDGAFDRGPYVIAAA